jgi:hypothetical protein
MVSSLRHLQSADCFYSAFVTQWIDNGADSEGEGNHQWTNRDASRPFYGWQGGKTGGTPFSDEETAQRKFLIFWGFRCLLTKWV